MIRNLRFGTLASLLFLLGFSIITALVVYAAERAQEMESEFSVGGSVSYAYTLRGATINTSMGRIEIEFLKEKAPRTVYNFIRLAEKGFYDGTKFHRVIPDFMIQGGDPLSKENDPSVYGRGGPGYKFSDEINDIAMARGVVAMANSGKNTNGSQFFILVDDKPHLQDKHTIFGIVSGGMDVVDAISRVPTTDYGMTKNVPETPVVVESVSIK